MFPRKNRITKKEDFDNVFKKGKSFHSSIFIIKMLPNDLDYSRFGFVISKKISNKAVIRNKSKRLLREVFRKNQHLFGRNSDIVVYAKPAIVNYNFEKINQIVMDLFEK